MERGVFRSSNTTGGGACALYRYRDCVLHPDRHLAWTVLPVIPPHLMPPAVAWPALRVESPPGNKCYFEEHYVAVMHDSCMSMLL
jgi:hypothetical protein